MGYGLALACVTVLTGVPVTHARPASFESQPLANAAALATIVQLRAAVQNVPRTVNFSVNAIDRRTVPAVSDGELVQASPAAWL